MWQTSATRTTPSSASVPSSSSGLSFTRHTSARSIQPLEESSRSSTTKRRHAGAKIMRHVPPKMYTLLKPQKTKRKASQSRQSPTKHTSRKASHPQSTQKRFHSAKMCQTERSSSARGSLFFPQSHFFCAPQRRIGATPAMPRCGHGGAATRRVIRRRRPPDPDRRAHNRSDSSQPSLAGQLWSFCK